MKDCLVFHFNLIANRDQYRNPLKRNPTVQPVEQIDFNWKQVIEWHLGSVQCRLEMIPMPEITPEKYDNDSLRHDYKYI